MRTSYAPSVAFTPQKHFSPKILQQVSWRWTNNHKTPQWFQQCIRICVTNKGTQQANNGAKSVEQAAKPKSTEAAQSQGMWILAYAFLLQPLLTNRSTQGYSTLTSCCSKITDGSFIAVCRQARAHHAAKARHRSQQCTWKKRGSKTQPEIKLDFIKPALRLPLTAWLPICSEHTHSSHDFCDFTVGSRTDTGQGVSEFLNWIWDTLSSF